MARVARAGKERDGRGTHAVHHTPSPGPCSSRREPPADRPALPVMVRPPSARTAASLRSHSLRPASGSVERREEGTACRSFQYLPVRPSTDGSIASHATDLAGLGRGDSAPRPQAPHPLHDRAAALAADVRADEPGIHREGVDGRTGPEPARELHARHQDCELGLFVRRQPVVDAAPAGVAEPDAAVEVRSRAHEHHPGTRRRLRAAAGARASAGTPRGDSPRAASRCRRRFRSA